MDQRVSTGYILPMASASFRRRSPCSRETLSLHCPPYFASLSIKDWRRLAPTPAYMLCRVVGLRNCGTVLFSAMDAICAFPRGVRKK